MADKRVSDLTLATNITGDDLLLLEQNGEAKKMRGETLVKFVALNVDAVSVSTLQTGEQATGRYDAASRTLILGIPRGERGPKGNSIKSASVDNNGYLTITFDDGTGYSVGNVVGPRGPEGKPGAKGKDGSDITAANIDESGHLILTKSVGGLTAILDAGYCVGPKGMAADSFTLALPASGWSGNAQTVSHAKLAKAGYSYIVQPAGGSYGAYSAAEIYADDVTVDGKITFHCAATPTVNVTVNVLKVEVAS